MLSPDTNALMYCSAIQKSNGNVVLAYVNKEVPEIQLLEIDTCGNVLRQYQSSMREGSYVNSADAHGRIMITDQLGGIELLDYEFNLLGAHSLLQNGAQYYLPDELRYNSERNEIVCIRSDQAKVLTTCIFRFVEE